MLLLWLLADRKDSTARPNPDFLLGNINLSSWWTSIAVTTLESVSHAEGICTYVNLFIQRSTFSLNFKTPLPRPHPSISPSAGEAFGWLCSEESLCLLQTLSCSNSSSKKTQKNCCPEPILFPFPPTYTCSCIWLRIFLFLSCQER